LPSLRLLFLSSSSPLSFLSLSHTHKIDTQVRREDEKSPLLPLLLDLLICSWNSRSFFLLLCFCSILCCWHSISATLLSQTKSRVAGTASLTLLKCCEACTRLASLPPSLTSPARRHPLTSLLEVAQAIFKVRGSVSKNHSRQEESEEGEEGPRTAGVRCLRQCVSGMLKGDSLPLQGVRGREHLPAPAHQEHLQTRMYADSELILCLHDQRVTSEAVRTQE
jgi:hypothetical protein